MRISAMKRFRSTRLIVFVFFFQAEDGIRDGRVTGVQTCALPISGAINSLWRKRHGGADTRLARQGRARWPRPRREDRRPRAARRRHGRHLYGPAPHGRRSGGRRHRGGRRHSRRQPAVRRADDGVSQDSGAAQGGGRRRHYRRRRRCHARRGRRGLEANGRARGDAAGHATRRDRAAPARARRTTRSALTAMESWSFPPRYDEDYFPDASSRYWFAERETMPAGGREALILQRLREVCAYAYEHAPFYRRKWDEAGFHPSQLKSLEDFEARVPVVEKRDLRAAQERLSPFGDYLCVPEAEVFHIHGTSGTTGRPTAFAIGRDDWRAIANAHARVMWAMGLRPGDTICIAAIFSLYMGSWGALVGAERLRARSFPFGAGVAGMTARCAQWLDLLKPTAFYGTPTYALHLAQVAADEGLNPRDFNLRIMFFSGEPGASIPAVRGKIEDLFGARVIDCGSMAEVTPWMGLAGTAETSGMLCWQDIVYTEVCDPKCLTVRVARRSIRIWSAPRSR